MLKEMLSGLAKITGFLFAMCIIVMIAMYFE